MHHEPARELEQDNAAAKKARLGVRFFIIYLLSYSGFVAIGVLDYGLFNIEIFAGLNLAIVYGMSLILFAVLLGILYNYLCSRYEDQLNTKGDTP